MEHSTQSGPTQSAPPAGIGRPLVAGLLLLGAGLACFAVWFQWQQTRQCLAFYGSEAARSIQAASRVELWEPSPLGTEPRAGADAAAAFASARRTDISRAPGLVHLRRGLVEDANFDWRRVADAGTRWDAAFAFFDTASATSPTTVLVIDFDPAGGTVGVAGRDGRVGLGRIEKGLRAWLGALQREQAE